MTRLIANSTPAERDRGCVFSETFESNAKVISNGGTITGSPTINFGYTKTTATDVINYGDNYDVSTGTFSLVCRFKVSSSGDNEHIAGKRADTNWYRIYKRSDDTIRFELSAAVHITSGSTYADDEWHTAVGVRNSSDDCYLYIDGVQVGTLNSSLNLDNTGDLTIGKWNTDPNFNGSIKDVQVYDKNWTLQEALDFTNNDTYNYRNEAVIDLPFKMEQHDSVNKQTLDVSGNGNNGLFGSQLTGINFPTKLSGRGYSWDGSADFLREAYDLDAQLSGSTFTIAMLIKFDTTASMRLVESTTDADNGLLLARTGAGDLRFYVKTATVNKAAKKNTIVMGNGYHTIIATYDNSLTQTAGSNNIYVDNIIGAGAYDVAGLNASNPGSTYIGSSAALGTNFDGNMLMFQIYDKVLTPLQREDLHINMMKKVNDI